MGATESKSGNNSDDSDGEEWMQADKYAEWECADRMDYNGTAMVVRHVEMPLDKTGKMRLTSPDIDNSGMGGFGITHEALVFDVMCTNGSVAKFTAELTFSGVLKRWGHHKVISSVKGHKTINLSMDEVLKIIETPRGYDLFRYNCKHYCVDKLKLF
jgi:hypothetical protein